MRADYEIKPISTREWTDEELQWLLDFDSSMREADRRELVASCGDTWTAVVQSIMNSEEAYRVTGAAGEPLVLYGKCVLENIPGRLIWCVATDRLKPYEREFARVSRRILRDWAKKHGILWNAVGDFNDPAKRWLQWCGAEFGKMLTIGGESFVRFYIRGQ